MMEETAVDSTNAALTVAKRPLSWGQCGILAGIFLLELIHSAR